jgi:hypothetical protein
LIISVLQNSPLAFAQKSLTLYKHSRLQDLAPKRKSTTLPHSLARGSLTTRDEEPRASTFSHRIYNSWKFTGIYSLGYIHLKGTSRLPHLLGICHSTATEEQEKEKEREKEKAKQKEGLKPSIYPQHVPSLSPIKVRHG